MLGGLDQQPLLFQCLQHGLVRVLYEHARPRGAGVHAAVGADQLNKRQVVGVADARVVFTERGRDVNNTGTFGQRYIAVGYDVEGLLALQIGVVEQRLVLGADQFLALPGLDLLDLVARPLRLCTSALAIMHTRPSHLNSR